MAEITPTINISSEELKKSAVQFKKQLLVMPVIGARRTLQHMTGRPGVRGRQVVGEMSGDAQFGPYSNSRKDTDRINIKPRTLETFLGSVVKDFDPNEVWQTIYGSLIAQGEGLKNVDIARAVLSFIAAKLGKNLNMSIWDAARDESGTTTKALFNGFDTITTKEITAGTIGTAQGNYLKLTESITSANAVDVLKTIYRAASDELQEEKVKLFITRDIYNAYVDDYQQTVGSVFYNREFEKSFLEGSNGLCELVPLASKNGSKFIHMSPQSNMLYGYGNGIGEKIEVDRFSSFVLTYAATLFFGVEFESVSKERLLVAELATAQSSAAPEPETTDPEPQEP